ncbi:hypothetical protein BDV96DRAFT_608274 [Lophiotrema nucula]|uniref:Uncharacterized protein n=1 Tax=Lophiotrema nucula TaxID=690887 RepID=A0A6A5YE84_9PLEO|nr:hypothetical protein BDV96DRAFT_608274 [Lophiotrema nucula]
MTLLRPAGRQVMVVVLLILKLSSNDHLGTSSTARPAWAAGAQRQSCPFHPRPDFWCRMIRLFAGMAFTVSLADCFIFIILDSRLEASYPGRNYLRRPPTTDQRANLRWDPPASPAECLVLGCKRDGRLFHNGFVNDISEYDPELSLQHDIGAFRDGRLAEGNSGYLIQSKRGGKAPGLGRCHLNSPRPSRSAQLRPEFQSTSGTPFISIRMHFGVCQRWLFLGIRYLSVVAKRARQSRSLFALWLGLEVGNRELIVSSGPYSLGNYHDSI